MNLVARLLFNKHIEEKDKLIAENEELKRKYELERRKSAYWIMKADGKTPTVIGSKEDIEYITKGVTYVEQY